MMRLKRVLAVLGVSGLMLGLVALYAGSSQAEKGASWMVNGETISGSLLPVVALEVDVSPMVLLTTIGGKPVELSCTGAEFIGAKLEAEGRVSPGNKTKFSGCIFKSGGKVIPACQPESGGESGVIISNGLTGLIVLHEGEPLIRFEPTQVGGSFVTINLGEECNFGENCTVEGISYVKDANGEFETNLVEHLVEQEKSLSTLKVNGGSSATIVGSAFVYLSGAHEGDTWSAQPG